MSPLNDAQRRLRKSKDAERSSGRWLLEHDGPDPVLKGIASSTGRVGHITGMQIDVISKTYAAEVKNIRVWAGLWKFWLKIVDRATERGKEPLIVLVPTNEIVGLRKRVPALHIITDTRHAELLRKEKIADEREEILKRAELRAGEPALHVRPTFPHGDNDEWKTME